MQAALGISQLKRLDSYVKKRREIANFFFSNLKGLVLPFQHPDTHSSWHLFVIQTKNRRKVFQQLIEEGIQTQVHYIPVNSQPFYIIIDPNNFQILNEPVGYMPDVNDYLSFLNCGLSEYRSSKEK